MQEPFDRLPRDQDRYAVIDAAEAIESPPIAFQPFGDGLLCNLLKGERHQWREIARLHLWASTRDGLPKCVKSSFDQIIDWKRLSHTKGEEDKTANDELKAVHPSFIICHGFDMRLLILARVQRMKVGSTKNRGIWIVVAESRCISSTAGRPVVHITQLADAFGIDCHGESCFMVIIEN